MCGCLAAGVFPLYEEHLEPLLAVVPLVINDFNNLPQNTTSQKSGPLPPRLVYQIMTPFRLFTFLSLWK
jgi:hypothetical protein